MTLVFLYLAVTANERDKLAVPAATAKLEKMRRRGTKDCQRTISQSNRTARDQPMASHQSKEQKDTVGRVMHEFKRGELETSRGRKVKNPKQAIAIGVREAGASKYESKEKNRKNLKRTKARERLGSPTRSDSGAIADREITRSELYAQARRRDIRGRSKMSKNDLKRALQSH
jgi:uncharacterized protein DUF6496